MTRCWHAPASKRFFHKGASLYVGAVKWNASVFRGPK